MLILTRRIGERIVIGGNIIIEVIDVTRHGIRLGVTAPHTLEIDREEVHLRKVNERGDTTPRAAIS